MEWPFDVYANTTESMQLRYEDESWPLVDVDLSIKSFDTEGPIEFAVQSPKWSVDYALDVTDNAMQLSPTGPEARVITARTSRTLSEFVAQSGLIVHFEQDAILEPPATLLRPQAPEFILNEDKLVRKDWSGVDLRRESQGASRDQQTVQARAIRHLIATGAWDVVIDDDGAGEIADVVAIRATDHSLIIRLLHCKYSSADRPGARVGDLYEVCGQAQKSVRWRHDLGLFFSHLIRREKGRLGRFGRSGFEVGEASTLFEVEERSRLLLPDFGIVVVQPGISKRRLSDAQKEVLASTDAYVLQATSGKFEVWCSD